MKLSQLAGMDRNPLIVTPRYEAFLRSEQPYSAEANEFIADELAAKDRDRSGSFSASALGGCARQQQFTFLGWIKVPESAKRMAVLMNGKMVHLRIQAVGITEGFLAAPEVPVKANDLGLKGTMDGVLSTDEVLEIKSSNDRAFKHIGYDREPKSDHVFQVGTYMLVTGRDKAVIFYENKNTQETREFTVELTDELVKQVMKRAIMLNESMAIKSLMPMLDECAQKKGWRYDYCPYRDRCPLMKTFRQAENQAEREAAA